MARTPKSPVTIEMVAAEAGVSKTTVSFVLNNNPTISETTRAKVLRITREMGYQPNINARNLSSSKRARAVCVLVPELGRLFEDPYFSRAIGGVYDELEAADYRLILRKASYDFAREKEYLNLFRRGEIAGMLYVGSTLDDRYLADFIESPYPFVLVNSAMPGIPLSSVKADNFEAGRQMTAHLLALGHRRVGHITGSLSTLSAVDRLAGYRKAIEEAGIEYDDELVAHGHFNRRDAVNAAFKLMEQDAAPTALYVGNDTMALGVLEAFADKGIRVPEEVAVTGTDNIEVSAYTRPSLTTVETSTFEVAREAVRLLFALMDNKAQDAEQRVVGVQPIVRQSCGAAFQDRRQAVNS